MEVSSIYREFHQQLLGYIRNKIRSKEDGEDILQNVFMKISSNVDKLTDEVKLKNWIFTITRNAIIDYYRMNASAKKVAVMETINDNLIEANELDSTLGLDRCVESMINLLPEEYRLIIRDSEIQGISQKELAEKYDMAYPSMRSRVQRGRERLKQLFHNCCHIETDKHGNILDIQSNRGCGGPCDPCNS